jgi:hypothetical protein
VEQAVTAVLSLANAGYKRRHHGFHSDLAAVLETIGDGFHGTVNANRHTFDSKIDHALRPRDPPEFLIGYRFRCRLLWFDELPTDAKGVVKKFRLYAGSPGPCFPKPIDVICLVI